MEANDTYSRVKNKVNTITREMKNIQWRRAHIKYNLLDSEKRIWEILRETRETTNKETVVKMVSEETLAVSNIITNTEEEYQETMKQSWTIKTIQQVKVSTKSKKFTRFCLFCP